MDFDTIFAKRRVAVITGAASGIGLAAASRFAARGMRVCLADRADDALSQAADSIAAIATNGADDVISCVVDVRREDELLRMKETVYETFGDVAILMNNAAVEQVGKALQAGPEWRNLIETNLMSVIHGTQIFAPAMIEQGTPAVIVNTGSKQGITCPPGNAGYNVAKAGVKAFTEQVAHELRSIEGCAVSAHLLVPGFTFTGFTRAWTSVKPEGAWMPEQVIDFMLERLAADDFYILCPDNDVTREMDNKRMQWAADDLISNRPALSRWHPDFAEKFDEFMKA